MDARISIASRPDVVLVESTPRPTPTPTRVSFGQVISAGASSLVQGAELAASKLPGSPISAAAVRGGAVASPLVDVDGTTVSSAAEGPTGAGTSALGSGAGLAAPAIGFGGVSFGSLGSAGGVSLGGSGSATGTSTDSTSSIDASLQQSAQMNLYYLQIQQEVDSANRSFTTLSNVLKTEHDSAKAAIDNVHS